MPPILPLKCGQERSPWDESLHRHKTIDQFCAAKLNLARGGSPDQWHFLELTRDSLHPLKRALPGPMGHLGDTNFRILSQT